jgi:AcrR family transcriptional regulator
LSNHAERRAHILDALLRIAGDRGLHAVSMRTVAAESGVTVSTVQYYFHTKEQLLFAGLEHLARALSRRAAAAGNGVRDWLIQLIPADDEQRASYTVFAAYHALALTNPGLGELPYASNSAALQQAIAAKLPGPDADAEAAILLALATGLGDSVMAGMRSPDEAIALLDRQLARIGLVV